MPIIEESKKVDSVRFLKILNTEPNVSIAIHHQIEAPQQMFDFVNLIYPVLAQRCFETFGEKVLLFGTELKEL